MNRVVIAVGSLALVASIATARDLEDILRDKGVIDKSESIEAKAAKEQAGGPSLPPLPDWLNKVTFSGDVRVRNDSSFRKNEEDRIRQRFRLRFGAKVKVNDETELGFRLASGNPDDPISNNQSFDDQFTFKRIAISNAYLKLMPGPTFGWARPYATLLGGKFDVQSIYVPTRMIFDWDLTPEGFVETVKPIESTEGFLRGASLNLGQWVFDEQANTSEGAMYAFQGVANLVPMDGVFVNVGAADFLVKRAGAIARARTTNDQLSITNTVALSDGSRIGGRRIDPTKLGTDADDNPITVLGFVSDFNLVNVNGDVSIATGKPRWPLQAWADYVNNTDANVSEDTGYQIGAGIGGKKDPGDVNFSYAWQHLETDAVVSAFSDSDYARDGGTNGEGHILQLNYVPLKNLTLTSTAWIVDPIVDVEGRSKETDYRWQVDLIAKF